MSDIKIEDKRHWAKDSDEPEVEVLTDEETETVEEAPRLPSFVEELKTRAEIAETKLHEYIEAFKKARDEQDEVRARLTRDVERRVQLQFAGLVGSFLETLDNLDLALENTGDSPADDRIDRAKHQKDGQPAVRGAHCRRTESFRRDRDESHVDRRVENAPDEPG